MTNETSKQQTNLPTILAAASGGGHWNQMMQLRPALEISGNVIFATTDPQLAKLASAKYEVIEDYNQSQPMKILKGLFAAHRLIRKIKPDIVVSTGAAPGLVCLLLGHLSGARTIWVDSIANAEKLSLSGRIASNFASITLTQWEALSDKNRIQYAGSVL
ncbi:MAG: hypothetical protein HWE26_21115 [Alteromonadaceae bacterium]|nr:hypothetical protein [Alteromonadaceae bacterium]